MRQKGDLEQILKDRFGNCVLYFREPEDVTACCRGAYAAKG